MKQIRNNSYNVLFIRNQNITSDKVKKLLKMSCFLKQLETLIQFEIDDLLLKSFTKLEKMSSFALYKLEICKVMTRKTFQNLFFCCDHFLSRKSKLSSNFTALNFMVEQNDLKLKRLICICISSLDLKFVFLVCPDLNHLQASF